MKRELYLPIIYFAIIVYRPSQLGLFWVSSFKESAYSSFGSCALLQLMLHYMSMRHMMTIAWKSFHFIDGADFDDDAFYAYGYDDGDVNVAPVVYCFAYRQMVLISEEVCLVPFTAVKPLQASLLLIS
jgi:hypothetical protein